jgi:oligopeptide/dipeptide ABC transporter ATP-binding protein
MRWYATNKEWESLFKPILILNLIWLIMNLTLGILFIYFFGSNLLFNFLLIGLNIIIGSYGIVKIYNKNFKESMIFVSTVQALLFIVDITLGFLLGIGAYFNTYLGELLQPSLLGVIYIIIPLVIGSIFTTLVMRAYTRKKEWEEYLKVVITLNLLWLIIDVPFAILLLYLPYKNLFLIYLTVSLVNICLSLIFFKFVYYKNTKESIKIIAITQIFSITLLFFQDIEYLITVVVFSPLNYSEELGGSFLTLIISIPILMGVCIFAVYWGNKIQLVEGIRYIALFSLFPGISFITYTFLNQLGMFINNFFLNLLMGSLFSIFTAFFIKHISYTTISLQEIRELTVLEKGKKILQVENLKVYYPLIGGVLKRQIGAVKAVDGISFEIETGETVGLVGESGCGKTTVAKAILGLVKKEEGEIYFRDSPIPPSYSSYLRQKIQIVFQDPDASLNPRMKVIDIVAEPLRNLLAITNQIEIRQHILRLMEEVSLKREHLDRYPHEFSGGQKQRIIIARALASSPELIILDEPTSALDVSVQAQILNLLKALQKTYRYGFLFITHNLAVVNHIADRVAIMYLGKIVEIGSTEQIFTNPSHPYTQALLSSRSEIDPFNQEISFVISGEVPSPINPPSGCPFNPRCTSDARTKECEQFLPHKIKIEDGHYIWCNRPPI